MLFMINDEQNMLASLQNQLAESLASYKREHMAHSVTLQQLEAARIMLESVRINECLEQDRKISASWARFRS
jgi:hypothetical protein